MTELLACFLVQLCAAHFETRAGANDFGIDLRNETKCNEMSLRTKRWNEIMKALQKQMAIIGLLFPINLLFLRAIILLIGPGFSLCGNGA
jgi:hypothetical protein